MDVENRREMDEASKSEVPILPSSVRQTETDRSRQLYCMLLLPCAGGAMEVMENVPDGDMYEAWRRLHHAYYPRLRGR